MNRIKTFFGQTQSRPVAGITKFFYDSLREQLLFDLDDYLSAINSGKKITLEIGFGSGESLLQRAISYPDHLHVEVEPYMNGRAAFLKQMGLHAKESGKQITNVRLFESDALSLLSLLPPQSLDEIFFTIFRSLA